MMRSTSVLAAFAIASCGEPSLTAPPKGAPLLFEAAGKGVVVYSCEGPEGSMWVQDTLAEVIDLSDSKERPIGQGRSFYPPQYSMKWQANDGSAAVAQIIAQEPKEGEVPSLLLAVRTHEGGEGIFTPVETIRRIQSKGGVPPSRNRAVPLGTKLRVNYSALYQFFGAPK